MSWRYGIVSAMLLVTAGLLPGVVWALGVSPAVVEVTNLAPHMQMSRDIWFSRSEADQEETISVTISGPAADHITPDQTGTMVTFPAGEKMLRYPFVIHTDNLAAGVYEAVVTIEPYVNPIAVTEISESTQVLTGAEAVVRFTVVGTEVVEQNTANQLMTVVLVGGVILVTGLTSMLYCRLMRKQSVNKPAPKKRSKIF